MKILFDTSILIDNLRGQRKLDQLLNSVTKNDELYLPTVVIFELYSGLSSLKPEIVKRISEFKKHFTVVSLNWEIARKAGELNRDLKFKIDTVDYFVAATAIILNAEVVTLNKKHFDKIPGVSVFVY